MPFDAGSVVGHFKLDHAEYTSGAQAVNAHNASMTKSVFTAQLAYDAFKQVLGKVVAFFKDSVGSWNEQEKVLAQTEARLKSTGYAAGMTKDELVNLSGSMMDLTGVADEQVLAAENLLLTFTKIGKDIFPQATQAVLDLSVATGQDATSAARQLGMALEDPVLGLTRMRRAGIIFTDAQKDVVKNLVATGQSAEAQQVILKALDEKYAGSAAAARDTFGGALTNLNNQFGETKEAVGRYIAAAARPYVESVADMAKGVTNFLNSAKGMAAVQSVLGPVVGIFSVLFDIGKSVWNMLKNLAGDVITDVKNAFTAIVGKGNEASVVFDVLGGVVKVLSISFTIVGKVVHGVIQYIVDLVDVARKSIAVLTALGDAMLHPLQPDKWRAVGAAAVETWESIKTLGVNAFSNVKDLIVATIEEFKMFSTDAHASGLAIQAAYEGALAKLNAAFEDFATNAGTTVPLDIAEGNEEAAQAVKKSWMEAYFDLTAAAAYAKDAYGAFSFEAQEATDAIGAHVLKLAREGSAEWRATYDQLMQDSRLAVMLFGAYSDEAAKAIDAVSEHIKAKGQETHAALTTSSMFYENAEVTVAEEVGKTWEETFSEVAGYASDMFGRMKAVSDAYYDGRFTALDNEYKAQKRYIAANVADEGARKAQLEALDKDYADRKAALQRRQWQAQKQASIVGIVMNTAEAVVKALTLGPIVGPIMGTIIGALGLAQLAVVNAQPMPDFAERGGVFPAGDQVVVGERGPELITVGQTSRVVPYDELTSLGGGVVQNNNFYGPIASEVDLDVASLKMARRMQAALRSA